MSGAVVASDGYPVSVGSVVLPWFAGELFGVECRRGQIEQAFGQRNSSPLSAVLQCIWHRPACGQRGEICRRRRAFSARSPGDGRARQPLRVVRFTASSAGSSTRSSSARCAADAVVPERQQRAAVIGVATGRHWSAMARRGYDSASWCLRDRGISAGWFIGLCAGKVRRVAKLKIYFSALSAPTLKKYLIVIFVALDRRRPAPRIAKARSYRLFRAGGAAEPRTVRPRTRWARGIGGWPASSRRDDRETVAGGRRTTAVRRQ